MSKPTYKKLFCQFRNALLTEDTVTAATVLAAVSKAKHPKFFQQLQRAFHPDLQSTQRKKKNPYPKTIEERQGRCHARTFTNGTGDGCCTFDSKEYVTLPGKQGKIGLCSLHAKLFNTCHREGIPHKGHEFYFWKHGQSKPESTIHTWKGKETTSVTVNLCKLKVGKINQVPYAYGMTYLKVIKHSDYYEISLSFPKTKPGKSEQTYTFPIKQQSTVTLTFPVPTGLKWGLKYDANHQEAPKVIYVGKCGQNGYSEEKFKKSCIKNIGAVTPPELPVVELVDSDAEDSDTDEDDDEQENHSESDTDEDDEDELDNSTLSTTTISTTDIPETTTPNNNDSSSVTDSQKTIEESDEEESEDEDSLAYVPNTDSDEDDLSDCSDDSM